MAERGTNPLDISDPLEATVTATQQDLDGELARAVYRRWDQRRLSVCAHELGHAAGELAVGIVPARVYLRFGLLGGFNGGQCEMDYLAPDATREQRTGRLVALLAGHAAEARFCRLYLGMDQRAAHKYGRDWAEGDYLNFDHFRGKFGLRWRISRDDAFAQASELVEAKGPDLDRLTPRLYQARQLTGPDLTPLAPARARVRRSWWS